MDTILLEIIEEIRRGTAVDHKVLARILHEHNKDLKDNRDHFAKKHLLPYYFNAKNTKEELWRSWNVDEQTERALIAALQMKPRRTASGVATITVITKPWFCGNDCLYCPNDVRMPKSYLHNEPACERAEQNWFDPYLQVTSRLTALTQMGHATDKIELIVLGGTWSDYPQGYQLWFISELFRALNEFDEGGDAARARRAWYLEAGFPAHAEEFESFVRSGQDELNAGAISYNRAFRKLYGGSEPWLRAGREQVATFDELELEQRVNEGARHRVVGLVIETRPDAITPEALTLIRRLGCTKVQMGIQTLDQEVLDQNDRGISLARIEQAFELLRVFGFKIHAHAMANLLGSTPERDKADYERLVHAAPFQPDEIKLYPCALIDGARLGERFRAGDWRPYTEDELLDVLVSDVAQTPAFCRISRMIRDFSSHDIVAGNKKPNLRQLVEQKLRASGSSDGIQEIRFREIGTDAVDVSDLRLDIVAYETSNTAERFLQWVTADGRIAGFLRLSLPDAAYIEAIAREVEGVGPAVGSTGVGPGSREVDPAVPARVGEGCLSAGARIPVRVGEAMIREVHVYGVATHLGEDGTSAQHSGLGRQLVERACDIARAEGYERINVISAVGTRAYYRRLGFVDHGLYQQREL